MNIVLVYVSNLAQCEDGDVRLRGGNYYLEERVEVCRNQQWGRVCDDMWDKNDSAVVFRRRMDPDILNTSTIPCRQGISCQLHYKNLI